VRASRRGKRWIVESELGSERELRGTDGVGGWGEVMSNGAVKIYRRVIETWDWKAWRSF
jgi:hypothetical protein